jgi:hypothetical protein
MNLVARPPLLKWTVVNVRLVMVEGCGLMQVFKRDASRKCFAASGRLARLSSGVIASFGRYTR